METGADDRRGTDRSAAVKLSPGIKLGMLIPPQPSEHDLRFANELGVTHVYTWVPDELSGAAELAALRRRVESAGLTLFNAGHGSLAKCDRIHLALPGRDDAIGRFAAFLRNLSAAGIHTTTFTFEPDGVWSTAAAAARGGAAARAVDGSELAEQPLSRGRSYDEGYQDMHVLMRLFHDGGYRGTMVLDHTPPMAHDPATLHNGPADRPVATAYAIGYMKALLAVADG